MEELLAAARAAHRSGDFAAAFDGYAAAARLGELDLADRGRYADAAWWTGRNDVALAGFEEVYQGRLARELPAEAAGLAIELAFLWFLRGEVTVGSGWLSRARRLLAGLPECAQHGHLRQIEIDEAIGAGDLATAVTLAREVQDIGRRHGDAGLVAVAMVGEGVATVRLGEVARGFAVLDEAMLPVLAGELPPSTAGYVYCQLIAVCDDLADLRRASRWTEATERWCAQFTASTMFSGICRVHRAQLWQLKGRWQAAEREAGQACAELAELNLPAVAAGHYLLGELRRLRGDLSGAEESYLAAHRLGRDPQPGMALLRLAQGDGVAALAALDAGLLAEPVDAFVRARLLAARVECGVAEKDGSAAAAAEELTAIADRFASSGLVAAARHASGLVALAAGRPADAVPLLREALRCWHDCGARYPAARLRVVLGSALRELGDDDAAAREWDAAALVFAEVGARPEAAAVAALRNEPTLPGGLSARECEVLREVAAGRSNREVAAALVISEKTVARHLSNIYAKLDLSTRTAAAAFAHEHGLAGRRGG